ncbi:MAG: TetR/AcrR family transcriptional regulator [Sarcina sp.]
MVGKTINLFKENVEINDSMTDKKKKILEVCIDLFSEQGFSNVSTSQIAKAAGVAEGTIFKHFGKKEDILIKNILPLILKSIFKVVIEDFSDDNIELTKEGFRKFIHSIVSDRILFLSENKKIAKILITEVMYRKELRFTLFEAIPMQMKRGVNRILDSYREAGLIDELANYDIIRFVASNIFSYAMLNLTLNANFNDEEEIEKTVKFLVKGLLK